MAVDDSSLIAEVRAITDYDKSIMSDPDMEEVVNLAKREIQATAQLTDPDFYSGLRRERTLFWLSCIFAQVRTGEIEGADFEIGELQVDSDSDNSLYFDNFWRNYHSIGDGRPRGHITGQREDRDYAFDN